jgi:alanine racemase
VDLEAIAHNVGVLRRAAAPAQVWAVVKADAYGHGAVPVARAALAAGATGLCVALVQEGVELRRAGIDGPVLVLSEQPPGQLGELVAAGLSATVYRPGAIAALAAAARSLGARNVPVHLKIDTGMHRVGAAPGDAVGLAALVRSAAPVLRLEGVATHLATADEPGHPAVAAQLAAFDGVLAALDAAGTRPPLVHVANSAGALAVPAARHSLVRTGIAIYGIEPGPGVAHLCRDLRPALALKARVSLVKRVPAGDGISYGLRHTFVRDATVATVPVGYADGVPRRLFEQGGQVLIGGRRRPIVGVVTMDQLMVDCGDDPVAIGDEVVLLGEQTGPRGAERIRAEEWAERLGTIGYEIVCGISRRIERRIRPAGLRAGVGTVPTPPR